MRVQRKSQIEVFPAFRSGGSLPVPKPVFVLPSVKPSKPILPEPSTAKEEEVRIDQLTCHDLELTSMTPEVCDTSLIGEDNFAQVSVHTVTVQEYAKPVEAPPPPPSKPKPGSCEKHSRCHCALMSLEVPDFFALKV